MATISSKHIVDEIIAANGVYPGDPTVVKIVEYNNQFNGGLAWGLVYESDDYMRYEKSPACHNAHAIWERAV